MTNYEIAKQTRDENTAAHLVENKTIYENNIKLDEASIEFIDNTKKKKDLMADLNTTTRGYTTSKAEAREYLTESLLDICGIGSAYAHDMHDNPMHQLMNVNKSILNKLGQEAFDSFAGKTIKIATDNLIPMAVYGLTKDINDDAKENHDDYKKAKPLSAEIEAKITSINAEIDTLQDRNDLLLSTKLEKLIPLFRHTQSEFVNTFNSLNKIVNPPVKHTQVHAIITDADGNPLPGVTLTFQNQDKIFKILTGANGEVTERIAFGVYDITLSKEGLPSIELKEIKIKKGRTHKLNHKMS